jgi:polyhydroxyalkanoate synthesis regulator protein
VAYVIKRYANRKLYDPQQSQYVTLEGIMASQREADRILHEWAARCGWMPPAQRTPAAGTSPTVSPELAELRQEIAVLREQLQKLAARLPQ